MMLSIRRMSGRIAGAFTCMHIPTPSAAANLGQSLLHDHRHLTFILISSFLTAFASNTTSTRLPQVLTLATLYTYTHFLFPSIAAVSKSALLTVGIAIATAVPNIAASREALDTQTLASILLTCVSLITSTLVVGTLYLGWVTSKIFPGPTTVALPVLWAAVWRVVACNSPVGNYLTWSRPTVLNGYEWLVPVFGPTGQDFLTAAWAVVLSGIFQTWFMGSTTTYSDEDVSQNNRRSQSPTHTSKLAFALSALLMPSFFVQSLPQPVGDVDIATPLGVGCILPTFQRYKHHALTLSDYIDETKKFQNSARLLLWPEGAVFFASDDEREAAFKYIRGNITGANVGVSFEQLSPDPRDPSGKKAYKQTGIAVIQKDSPDPILLYYKRHLVPIAESYHLSRSSLPPTAIPISLPAPKGVPPTRWSEERSHTRQISITASICLDFAFPAPFSNLDARPDIILAPARTWERSIGLTMWSHANQRAAEIGSIVVWCDGGEGGVSGIGGVGYEGVQQVGPGSWVRNIAVQHPSDAQPTIYARWSSFSLVPFVLFALSFVMAAPVRWGKTRIAARFNGRKPADERTPLLIDL